MSKVVIDRAVVEQALESFETDDWQKKMQSAISLRAALEQSQVEQPVAWAVMQGGAICWETDYPFSNEPGWCDSDQQSVPLYTHPQPPRQPLTDEQIAELMMEAWGCASIAPRHAPAFARAIEAAHGIKEQK